MDRDPRTVLVIDDETATLTMFRLFLQAFGYRVLVAENGKSGMELVRLERPRIVFTDLKMPEMDGFEVLGWIKKHSPETEVIVITGHGDMDLAIQALNLDATDFINKPIKRTALDAALRRAEMRLNRSLPHEGRIVFTIEGRTAVITIEGTLRRENRKALAAAVESAIGAAPVGVLVRFADYAAFNGAGIAELINGLAAIRENGQAAAVAGLSENFRALSEMVGLTRFASLCDSESEAASVLDPKTPA
ncbi:MAG: response regulator [Desulfobacterales bacterium]